MNAFRPLVCAAVLAPAMMAVGPAGAVDQFRTHYFNAGAHCQGALPNFEGSIRKRPLGVQNEGTSNAFVTCGVPTQGRITGLEVYATTFSGADAQVTCTAVSGWQGGSNDYVPMTVTTPANGNWAGMFWEPSDFGGTDFFPSNFVALSCNLAPGTGLNDFWLAYLEDIGL